MKSYTAIYDFSLYPYALGDILTWNVRTAMATHEAGAKTCRIVVFADPAKPHCMMQDRPTADQFELFQCEIQPAFYAHPCATTFHLFHDRQEFEAYLAFLAKQGEIAQGELVAYQKIYNQRTNHRLINEHFAATIGHQHQINAFFRKNGFIPKIKEPVGARHDVEALGEIHGPDTILVSTQLRMRSLDQSIPCDRSFRDADLIVWQDFFDRCAKELPKVKFALLGRMQEKHLSVLALPNVIAPRALGLNLAHEISLLLRSDFYIGSSSGFAQLANFSDVPYRISKVNEQACEFYGIPFNTDRLPFSCDNQRLLYGPETTDGLFAALTEGIGLRSPRISRGKVNAVARNLQTTSRFFTNAAQGQHEAACQLLPHLQRAIQLTGEKHSAEALPELKKINHILLQMHRPASPENKVTVGMLMPNFNHGEFLDQAFQQMAGQTRPLDEIVVIDDGSTDGSAAKIRQWGTVSPIHKTVILPKNVGVDPAVKAGLDQITTTFFSPRSVDDTFFPTHIEKITELAEAYPRSGLVSFRALRYHEKRNQRFLGPQLSETPRYFNSKDTEAVLRRNYLWDAGIAWNTEAFKTERDYDWRLRWISALHIADVLAFRHGFCYVPEPLMEYNMRPQSFSSGGNDPLRHGEAFLASARDWCSPAKADIFNGCVRSGFFGLRENALVSIFAVLNGAWQDHGKPLLLIIQGLLEQLDQHYHKIGIAADKTPRKEIQGSHRIVAAYNQPYIESQIIEALIPVILPVIQKTPLNNPFVGFYAGYLIRKGRHKEAQELLRTSVAPGGHTKAVLRAFAQLAAYNQGPAAGDRMWREALAANPADVWFGMEFVRILYGRNEKDAAQTLARELLKRDGKSDVLKELREIMPDFDPAIGVDLAQKPKEPLPATATNAQPAPTHAPVAIASGRPPVRILFVSEKWCEKPGGALTNTIHNIFGSFKATGFGTYENFFIEEHVNVDADLLRHCRAYNPDLLIITYPTHHPKSPKAATFKTLHAEGRRMGFLWWDAVNGFIMKLADEVAPYCRANFILDFNSFHKDPRYVPVWTPQDPLIYNNPGLERTIDVSFAGSLNGMPERQAYLKFLHDHKVKVTQAGGQREQNLSVQDYARIYQQSKITLNFTKNRLNLFQTKGRSWEAISCGAVLFEQDNAEIRRWLTPGVDYVPFNTPEELLTQIKRFLAHPELLQEFSRKGQATFEQNYTAAHWWRTVLDKCLDGQPATLSTSEAIAADTPAPAADGEIFSDTEVDSLTHLVKVWQDDPAQTDKLTELLALRQELSAFLLDAEPADLAALFTDNFGRVYRLLLRSNLPHEIPTDTDKVTLAALQPRLAAGTDLRALLAHALFRPAHEAPVDFSPESIPTWFWEDFLTYSLAAPQGFSGKGEADRYLAHLLKWVKAVAIRIKADPKNELTAKLAQATTLKLNLIPVYFTAADVRELMTLRAEIMSFTLRAAGNQLDARFPVRSRRNGKIKVGFLNAHFGPQTETYTSLPTLNIDREKFEIHLFVQHKGTGPLIDHCTRHSDHFVVLPPALTDQVATIRAAELDIILIGTNVTAVTNQITLIALHKLAPIQLTSCSSPMTTGMKTFDGYLSGAARGFDAYGTDYTEPLLLIDSPINCFEFTLDPAAAIAPPTRKDLGLTPDQVLFVSGANFHKILPELRETWAKILQRVPGSTLLLHPFNPNWSNQYPIRQFSRQMKTVLAEHNVDPSRLLISTNTMPSRSDVGALMALGDIYLDSYPLSGSVSLVDPLQAGVPPVIWKGRTFRSLMATSMMHDLDLQELVTDNETDYIDLAARLAADPALRKRLRADIQQKMARSPRFFDCADYGRNISKVLENLFNQRKPTGRPTGEAESSSDSSVPYRPTREMTPV